MRTAFCVIVGAGVIGGWALTRLSYWLEDYLDALLSQQQLDEAERAYWLAREAADERGETPLYDAIVCQQMEAQFDA
jgi:hypothetical protein